MSLPRFALCTAALLLAFSTLNAQSVTTTPVGAVNVSALANSETFLSVPLSRPAVFTGTVAGVSGNVITVSGAPAWATNVFAKNLPAQPNTYYVRLRSGSLGGQYFTISANSANTLTVDSNGLDLSLVGADEKLEIAPYWTLGSLFPAANAGSAFVASATTFSRQTELYFPNLSYNGINPPTDETFFFYNGAWRKVGADAAVAYDDRVVLPDMFFRLRNRASATNLTIVGQVESGPVGTVINKGTIKLDNIVAIPFPTDVTLANSGLISSGAFQASSSAFSRSDELLVYSDDTPGLNRPSVATYYYLNSAWRKVGEAATTDFSNDKVFKAAKGVVIRKAAGVATSQLWTYTASIP
jgi:Verrucomicrobium spinosum paralogous family TIGR02597